MFGIITKYLDADEISKARIEAYIDALSDSKKSERAESIGMKEYRKLLKQLRNDVDFESDEIDGNDYDYDFDDDGDDKDK